MSGDILEQLGLNAPVSEVDRSQVQSQVLIDEKSAKKDPIIEVDEATFAYGRNIILESVEMQIHESEFWCFIGPNGEGKTTLIKALLGALRPKRGFIRLRPDFARRTRIGFVPQNCDLNPTVPTTIKSFVVQGTAGLPVAESKLKQRVLKSLEVMGIQHIRDRSIWKVSGGQRQRAMVARALVRDPLLMIVDEPTAGLDLAASSGLLKTITDLNRQHGITVIFVTHDLQLAGHHASHVAVFKNRRVTCGPVAKALTGENLSNAFGVPTEVRPDPSGGFVVRANI
tara:strand:+ start:103 stop:954 length:852 start_codon:yes stop_codon:yes gene_type:complete